MYCAVDVDIPHLESNEYVVLPKRLMGALTVRQAECLAFQAITKKKKVIYLASLVAKKH
jgi:hypothetical protein